MDLQGPHPLAVEDPAAAVEAPLAHEGPLAASTKLHAAAHTFALEAPAAEPAEARAAKAAKRPREQPAADAAAKRSHETSLTEPGDAVAVVLEPEEQFAVVPAAPPLANDLPCAEALRVDATLGRLRAVLQAMTPDQRRCSIERMALPVRAALFAFMKGARTAAVGAPPREETAPAASPRPSMAGAANVRTTRTARGVAHQAQLRIGHLRMYARAQAEPDVALKHLAALAQVRRDVVAAGEDIWEQPARFCSIFAEALREHGTSEDTLGLGVFVYMRADEWIDRSRTITTPVMKLPHALEMHSRLLRARRTSWASLRAEWAPLLRCTQLAQKQGVSLVEAEAMAESARRGLLERQCKQAVCSVERAMARKRGRAAKMFRECMATRRRAVKALAAEAAKEQKLEQKRRELKLARWQWLRRADLTMAEMLDGPPQHLKG